MHSMVEYTNDGVKIHLTESQVQWCREHAERTTAYHNQNGIGEYTHNRVMGAIVGARCEVAVETFLIRLYQSLNTNFKEDISNEDITLKGKSIEVKGLRGEDWDKLKRMIPPKQLEKYVKNDVVIVWATTEPRNTVIIRGWNYPNELVEHGISITTICDNIWLKDDKLMREIETLRDEING